MPARLCLVVLATLVAGASAQPSAPPAVAEAMERLEAGDSLSAYQAVQDALRRSPNTEVLRRLQLELRLAGQGVERMPVDARAAHLADSARRLLRVAPGDTTALRVLVDEAVWRAVIMRDRVRQTQLETGAAFSNRTGARARRDRRDEAAADRDSVGASLSLNLEARAAHDEGLRRIAEWLAVDPSAVRPYQAAATLAAAAEDWPGVLSQARRLADATEDPLADLYAGLAHYRLGDAEAGGAAFDRALGRLGEAERARYLAVRPLLPLDLHAAYDADPGSITETFWALADPWLLSDVNERRVEHLARVVEADLLLGSGAAGPFRRDAPRGADTVEGDIWVRYGRPRTRSRRTFDNVVRSWGYQGFGFVFEDDDFDGEARLLSPPASAYGDPRSRAVDYEIRSREMQRTDPQRTQDRPRRLLDLTALVSRFRTPAGGTEVVVAYGVPLGEASPIRAGVFAISGLEVVDRQVAEHRRTSAADTLRLETAALRFRSGGSVRIELEAEHGDARARVIRDVRPLPGGFGVSDVLLATSVDAEGRGPVVRDGLGIVPAADATFATGDPVWVVVEAYGLMLGAEGTRYSVEAELRPDARRGGVLGAVLGRGQDPGVAVRSEGEGEGADEALVFFLDVSDQRPGAYTLTVTVTDRATGASASSMREVVLR